MDSRWFETPSSESGRRRPSLTDTRTGSSGRRVPTRDQVEAVAAGEADLTFDVARSERLDDIFVRFPGQVHSSPNPQTLFIVLDTRSPPFDEPEVRRAMNLVIDRDRVVQIFGGEGAMRPTCQQIPQNFPPGTNRIARSPRATGGKGIWAAPGAGIEETRAIVRRSGTAGMRVVFEYPPEYWPQGEDMGAYVVDLLDKVGYRGSVRPVALGAFYDPKNEFQMALAAWTSDYPAASNFINGWLTCEAPLTPRSGFCDTRIDDMIEEATRVQINDPVAAGVLWAEVDRAIVDRAPYVWLANRNIVNLVSERVGNYQFNSHWGPLLNQLWVR